MGTVYVQACDVANIASDGTCAVPVWVEKPEPVLPTLTLAEGTQVALAIVSVWTVGLCFRLYRRAAQQ
jgi:hypothetical protein